MCVDRVCCIYRHEAMTDLMHLMSGLVDRTGNLLIPGIYDKVAPLVVIHTS